MAATMRKPSEIIWLDSEVTRLPMSRYLNLSTILSGVSAAIESGCNWVASESTCAVTALVASLILLAAVVSGAATGICMNILLNIVIPRFETTKVIPYRLKKD